MMTAAEIDAATADWLRAQVGADRAALVRIVCDLDAQIVGLTKVRDIAAALVGMHGEAGHG